MHLSIHDTRRPQPTRTTAPMAGTSRNEVASTSASVLSSSTSSSAARSPASRATVVDSRSRAAHGDQSARHALEQRGSGTTLPLRGDPAVVAKHAGEARYARASGETLFANGASPQDVVQGRVGDCWLLGSFAAVAATEPEAIARAIRANGDGTYTARFFTRAKDGSVQTEQVRIDGDVPRSGGQPLYARSADAREMWPALLEKAWASRSGGYARLDGGVPNDALFALTGRTSSVVFTRGQDRNAVFSTLAAGTRDGVPMVAASKSTLSLARDGIVPGHAYTVLGTGRVNGQDVVELRDTYAKYEPRGDGRADGTFRLTAAEFHARFQYVVVGTPKTEPARPAFRGS